MVEFEPVTPEQRKRYLLAQIEALRGAMPAYNPDAAWARDVSRVFGGFGAGKRANQQAMEAGYNRREEELEALQGQYDQLR